MKDTIVYFGAGTDIMPLWLVLAKHDEQMLANMKAYMSSHRMVEEFSHMLDVHSFAEQWKDITKVVYVDPEGEDNVEDFAHCFEGFVLAHTGESADLEINDGGFSMTFHMESGRIVFQYFAGSFSPETTPLMEMIQKKIRPRMHTLYLCNVPLLCREFFDFWMRPAELVVANPTYFNSYGPGIQHSGPGTPVCFYDGRCLKKARPPFNPVSFVTKAHESWKDVGKDRDPNLIKE